jgi:hypothetical protein
LKRNEYTHRRQTSAAAGVLGPFEHQSPDAVSLLGSDRSAESFSEALKKALSSAERPTSPRPDPWDKVPALGVMPAPDTSREPTILPSSSSGSVSAPPVTPHETSAYWPDLGGLMSEDKSGAVEASDELVTSPAEFHARGRAERDSSEIPPTTPPSDVESAGLAPQFGMGPAEWGNGESPDFPESATNSTSSSLTPVSPAASSADLGGVSFSGLDASGLTAPLADISDGPNETAATDDMTPAPGVGLSFGLEPWSLDDDSPTLSTSFNDLSRVDLGADVSRSEFFGGGNVLATDAGAVDDLGGGIGPGTGNASLAPFRGASSATTATQDEEPALDLARTNDLLQQLLDEVRKGRTSFLPTSNRNSEYLYQSR